MKAKSLALIAGSGAVLMLAGQASARFLGITTESIQNEFGLLTVRVYAEFDAPGEDSMTAVAGTQNSPLLIQVVGGTLMVLKAGQHPMREIEQAVKRLKQADVNLRGLLFNDVNVQSQRYGAGKYSYQYSYNKS